MEKTLYVTKDEGKNWEGREIPIIKTDSMSNPHGGGYGLCLDCTSILCHYIGCDIALDVEKCN